MAGSKVVLAARAVRHKLRAVAALGAFWPAVVRGGKLLARGQVRQFAGKFLNETASIRAVDAAPTRAGSPLFLAGHILRPGGYDHVVSALLKGLLDAGVNVHRDPGSVMRFELIPEELRPAESPRDLHQPRIAATPPHLLNRFHPDRRTAALTMWETDALPTRAVAALNRCGLAIVPSRWGAECFRRNGVTVPIEVVPLGYDPELFHPAQGANRALHLFPSIVVERSDRSCECNFDPALGFAGEHPHPICRCLRIDKPTFPPQCWGRGEEGDTGRDAMRGWLHTAFGTAGALDDGGLRKNVQRVIDLFRTAFPTEADVRLRVKITPSSPPVDCHRDSRIDVVQHSLSPAELAEWYCSLTAYVNGSFGEGFGLHLLEAMACGRPLISTAFGGASEFFDGRFGYEVGHRSIEARNAIYTGRWADPNDDEMIAAMRQVHADRDEAIRRGQRAAERAAPFTWAETVRKLVEVLRRRGFLPEHHERRGE